MAVLKEGEDFQDLIFPCEAYDGDYLRITWEDSDDLAEFRMLWIEYANPRSLWHRLKRVWYILRGKDNLNPGILLSKEHIEDLRKFLESK